MTIKKDGKKWLVDVRPASNPNERVRKKFDTKAEALRFEAWLRSKAVKGEWNPKQQDKRTLKELIQTWFDIHGQHLKDSDKRLNLLNYAADAMGNPKATNLKPEDFLRYRETRISEGIKPKTVNNIHGYLNAVFNELYRNEIITYESPLSKTRKIKIQESELNYLTKAQIKEVFQKIEDTCINKHVALIGRICLATGCRWGEAQSLHLRHVKNNKITFTDTKSGKNRSVPISPELQQEIYNHGTLNKQGKLFTNSEETFRRTLRKCSFDVPAGQATHILRHTFASHFMINGGNILTLQRILGHSNITVTMRYAHLAPDHLEDAIKYGVFYGHFMDTLPNQE